MKNNKRKVINSYDVLKGEDMETTYVNQNASVQRFANPNAASVVDNSVQSMSLQRKADLASGAIQRMGEEEEEPVQGKSIQREAIPEEEELSE